MQEPISNLLQPERLKPYLAAHLDGFAGGFSAQKTDTGQSNPTFILSTGSKKFVLRRKPPGELLKSAHAIEREYFVMNALASSDVPVPQMFHLCEDETIIGKPFFVMEFVKGRTFNDPVCRDLSNSERRNLFREMNRTLAAIHNVDLDACGLRKFGRPGNYFERQMSRWSGQYRLTETETLVEMEELIEWLLQNMPPDDGQISLVHGDYRLDNLLVSDQTGEILAVLDWELSTLGHPMADLGAQLMQWKMPTGEEGRGLAGVNRKVMGIPDDRDYVEEYARNAGLSDIPDMSFFVAFSFFRMAAILQGVKKRALDGNASNPEKALKLGQHIPGMARKALATISAGF